MTACGAFSHFVINSSLNMGFKGTSHDIWGLVCLECVLISRNTLGAMRDDLALKSPGTSPDKALQTNCDESNRSVVLVPCRFGGLIRPAAPPI